MNILHHYCSQERYLFCYLAEKIRPYVYRRWCKGYPMSVSLLSREISNNTLSWSRSCSEASLNINGLCAVYMSWHVGLHALVHATACSKLLASQQVMGIWTTRVSISVISCSEKMQPTALCTGKTNVPVWVWTVRYRHSLGCHVLQLTVT